MIEAMACGTPVIAYDRGSVSEIMEQGAPDSSSIRWTKPSWRPGGFRS
jgi:glycosyltransferase involved in cell wall biosynthesis